MYIINKLLVNPARFYGPKIDPLFRPVPSETWGLLMIHGFTSLRATTRRSTRQIYLHLTRRGQVGKFHFLLHRFPRVT